MKRIGLIVITLLVILFFLDGFFGLLQVIYEDGDREVIKLNF